MPKRYRCIVLTAFGWLALANAQQDNQSKQKGKHSQNAPSTPVQNKPEAKGIVKTQEGCEGTTKPHISCEAISAQAAIDQAQFAAYQTGVGGFTLLAAVAAAIFARRAAVETKRGADVSGEALALEHSKAAEEFRPWITLSIRPEAYLMAIDDMIDTSIEVLVTNVGKTIARNVIVSSKIFVTEGGTGYDEAFAELVSMDEENRSKPAYHRKVSLPTQNVPVYVAVTCPLVEKDIYRIAAYAAYTFGGSDEIHHTWAVFDLFCKPVGERERMITRSDLPMPPIEMSIQPSGIGNAT